MMPKTLFCVLSITVTSRLIAGGFSDTKAALAATDKLFATLFGNTSSIQHQQNSNFFVRTFDNNAWQAFFTSMNKFINDKAQIVGIRDATILNVYRPIADIATDLVPYIYHVQNDVALAQQHNNSLNPVSYEQRIKNLQAWILILTNNIRDKAVEKLEHGTTTLQRKKSAIQVIKNLSLKMSKALNSMLHALDQVYKSGIQQVRKKTA